MVHSRHCWPGIFLGLLIQAVPCACQGTIKGTLQSIYDQTLTAMWTAKTTAEIERIVSQSDMPVTTHIGEDGHVSTTTRAQTIHELEGVIAQPNRQKWNVKIIWASRDQDHATAVAWVYTKSKNADVEGTDAEKSSRQPIVF
jgi:hypothetical protein